MLSVACQHVRPALSQPRVLRRRLSSISNQIKYFNGRRVDNQEAVKRLLRIPNDVIEETISDKTGCFNHFNLTTENDLSILLRNENGMIDEIHLNALRRIKEGAYYLNPGVPKKYIDLAHTYSVISMNPVLSDDGKYERITSANTLLHAIHWILVELIDKNKVEIPSQAHEKYANLISNGAAEMVSSPLAMKRFNPDIIHNGLKELSIDQRMIDSVIDTLKVSNEGLELVYRELFNYFEPKHLKFFNKKLTMSFESLRNKIKLTKSFNDMTLYLDSRALTAGCFPYTNLKYVVEADVYGLDQDELLDFQEKYDERYISNIELEFNKLYGIRNDRYSYERDFRENTASCVTIESRNQYHPVSLFFALDRTRKNELTRLRFVESGIDVLESQVGKSEQKYVTLVRTCHRFESLACSLYYFFDPRHQYETSGILKLVDPFMKGDEKLECFQEHFESKVE